MGYVQACIIWHGMIQNLREHTQKTFVTLSRFWPEVGGLSESVKKVKFVTKIFFSDNVEGSSKNLSEIVSANLKANTNNT